MNYYNDNDPKVAAWLRELIKQKLIPAGDVDERSIEDVTQADLEGYTQCHFFAGIGGWSEALRLAGWSADRPVWTGSCPCQPFSSAGKQKGTKDPRHLWPEFYRLIAECHPPVVFGEQVASPLGRKWLSRVRTDLERVEYAVGAADLCAASVGAPHIRQRLYWVADATGQQTYAANQGRLYAKPGGGGGNGGMENPSGRRGKGLQIYRGGDEEICRRQTDRLEGPGSSCGLENTQGKRLEGRDNSSQGISPEGGGLLSPGSSEPSSSFWSNSVWLPCADGKSRRIEPESFPLANGIPGRVGLLRGYGNAIVPQVAAEFIKAYKECDK